jgi:hypothetical protein
MEVYMINIDEEKDKLTQKLSEQYSQNTITMEEYERILEYINKIETGKEISIIQKIIQENNVNNNELIVTKNNEISIPKNSENHLSMFSWRTSNVEPLNGNGGKYISVFGTNQIIVDNLPKGRTVINVNSIFGLTEIIVSNNIKITNKTAPVFSGIFSPYEIANEDKDLPELYIVGKAVFGMITIKRSDEKAEEVKRYNELSEKITEKIHQKLIDKYKKQYQYFPGYSPHMK